MNCAAYLLELRADIDAKNAGNQTAMDVATAAKMLELVAFLQDAKQRVEDRKAAAAARAAASAKLQPSASTGDRVVARVPAASSA
jgi:hypothetical protein